MQLSQEWDKTFSKSDKVDHRKVTFKNRYGITLAGDLYVPKNHVDEHLGALAVSEPFGAVKEQSSGLCKLPSTVTASASWAFAGSAAWL